MGWLVAAVLAFGLQDDKKEMEALKQRMAEIEKRMAEKEGKAPQEPKAPDGSLPQAAQDSKRDAGEIYSKSFLKRFGRNVYLGGYMDLEFFHTEGKNNDTFDQHRFVPFIYADVSDHIKVAAEIEIEHGNGTELGIEFAQIDYWIAPYINFRAGIILDPLGHYNLVHDAPFKDLTTRPLVDEVIVPVVLREPGIGFFGSFGTGSWEFDYEVYLVNGFKGLNNAGVTTINTANGTRNARPHVGTPAGFGSAYRDFNDDKSVVGRFSASPFLGLEVGVSAHTGMYDFRGDNRMTISVLDLTMNLGGVMNQLGATADFWSSFEFLGEYARANIQRDAFARASGVPDDFDGFYVEGRYHFMPDFLREIIPGANEESTFTLVFRLDKIDLDGFKRRQYVPGLNFRLREDTVFKFEYLFRREPGTRSTNVENDQFVFSVATYF
jgi:hypothetical protein